MAMRMCRRTEQSLYLRSGRLADVLGLLQVLGFDSLVYRSESGVDGEEGNGGLRHELKAKPCSAQSWLQVAKEHPEFFRVDERKNYPISLICRHTYRTSPELKDKPFDNSIVHRLMELAVELHDRELRRSQGWTFYMPIWAAAISGVILLLKSLIEANGG